ncbi:MAG: hypothetical protein FJY77_03385 [Candidatus Altiarchaeales archaeon]|nr:hypothetical protein [Candidatus Altiarchaeales archaeon]
MFLSIVIATALLFLLLASIQDLKKGEISDKISIGFTITIMLLAISLAIYAKNTNPVSNAITIGFSYFIIAYVLFKLGQWGGGDVKILLGLGCTLGLLNSLNYTWNTPITPYHTAYFLNMGILAMPYALIYMLILSCKKPEVYAEFRKKTVQKKTLFMLLTSVALPLALYLATKFTLFIAFSAILPIFTLASLYLKTSEEILLTQVILVSELKEGDALAEDLKYEGKKIISKRDIEGLNQQQLKLIKKLSSENKIPSSIKIKWGVKFMPIITIAFLITLYAGDLMALILQAMLRI